MKTLKRMAGLGPLALVAFVLAAPRPAAADAHITVINADGPNEGFNDPTPAAPVGGNPGTTKGQQRLIAFQFAADLWGAALDTNVEINIRASFDPLGANVLGSAGAAFSIRNFNDLAAPGFPGGAPDTNYHGALADKRAGADLADELGLGASFPEIVAQFSSDFDFYLGLDNNHGAQNDLVVVLLHEFGHGLGFSSFMSRTTGNTPGGATDPFLNNALDGSTNTTLASLLASSAAVRLATIQKVDQIVWTGGNVAAGVPTTLLFGRPELFVPQLASIDGSRYGTAAFGPPIPANGISGFVVVAQDGVGVSTDACEPLTPANAVAVQGKIALVDRGTCTFVVKVKNAQNAGADRGAGSRQRGRQPACGPRRGRSHDHDLVGARAARDGRRDQGVRGTAHRHNRSEPEPSRGYGSPGSSAAVRQRANRLRIHAQPLGSDRVPQPADGAGHQSGPDA
jgi:hypothetical protein